MQVKGGGHASNPGFSSTEGVHISLAQFAGVEYDASSELAVVGAGSIWDTVYETLEEHERMVVGGRVTGVGVAGFTLGGGTCTFHNHSPNSFLCFWVAIILDNLRHMKGMLTAPQDTRGYRINVA